MSYTFQLRRSTESEWTSADPVLALGEPGYETDTGRIKYGDGVSAWSALPYFTSGSGNLPIPAQTNTVLRSNAIGGSWVESNVLRLATDDRWTLGGVGLSAVTHGILSSPNNYLWIGGTNATLGYQVDTTAPGIVTLRSATRGAPTTAINTMRLSAEELGFLTGGFERMRIHDNGWVSIGSPTEDIAPLYVREFGGSPACAVFADSSGDFISHFSTAGAQFPKAYTDTTTDSPNAYLMNSSPQGRLRRSTSSIRYKTDIQPYPRGMSEIAQVQPVLYKSISPDDGDGYFGGLTAENIDSIGMSEFVRYDENGQPDSIRYEHMVALLISGIQELEARLSALENP